LPGHKGGKIWNNRKGKLPDAAPGAYREWDVNPNLPGVDRGTDRIVTGKDGSAYFTNDHYETFIQMRGPVN
jgi:ribonuclease T1